MSQLLSLRASSSLHDVAALLRFQPKFLAYVLYKMPDATKYRSFSMAKRAGGTRLINAPCPELKLLQKNLSNLLQNCVAEINTARKFRDQLAHGFKRGHSIITNADRHRKKRYVFNIDLEDFFGTINFGRVRGFFIKNANFMLHPKVATVLAQIACHGKGLPQGSPCSPVVSNLVGHMLDIRLSRLALQSGCIYSRYADDITFSTNKPDFPSEVARRLASDPHKWEVGQALQSIITRSGFAVNPQKIRMQYHGSRQAVTGLVVNRKVNIRTEYRRTVRAMAQRLFMTGAFECLQTVADANGIITPTRAQGTVDQLQGMLSHIDFVDSENHKREAKFDSGSQKAKDAANLRLHSKRRLYRRFLLFKDFYSAQKPLVVCEGKTDNVYIVYAIKSLAASYPKLAVISANGKTKLVIRVLRTVGSKVERILHLGHGWTALKGVIEQYATDLGKFKAPGMTQPIILLVDNDSAATKILNTITQLTGKTSAKTDAHIHVMGNLYVVLTPLPSGETESEIEDFFDDKIRNLNLGGKTFSPDPKADTNIHFGKYILSEYVRVNAAKIDFTGFSVILDRITAAIEDYEGKLTAPTAATPSAAASS